MQEHQTTSWRAISTKSVWHKLNKDHPQRGELVQKNVQGGLLHNWFWDKKAAYITDFEQT